MRIKGRSWLAGILLLAVFSAFGQNRYVVHFKDKTGSPYSLTNPQAFLSPRAISRRDTRDVLVSEQDFPVNPSYVQQVRDAGANVFYSSRWMNCVLVQTSSTIASSLVSLPFVSRVEFVAPGDALSNGRTKSFKNKKSEDGGEATKVQLTMVGIDAMHEDNIRGEGVHVAVFDSGFPGVKTAAPFQHLFDESRITEVYDFIGNSRNVYRYDDHGTQVFSVMAASTSSFTGGAYNASFQLYVTEDVDTEYRVEEYNWLFAAEHADSAGADVITASLGYNTFDDPSMDYTFASLDGKTALISKAAAAAMARGIVVICSAGNEGNNSWGFVTPPADVPGIIAVGSVNASLARSSFSSKGPTADGRFKPDVMAMGSGTSVIKPTGTQSTGSGTSIAAPIVASLATGVVQKFPGLSVARVYDLITQTASRAATPDNLYGYGIPNYQSIKDEYQNEQPIMIFPNPTDSGRVSIWFKDAHVDAEVSVYDINGKPLISKTVYIDWTNNPLEVNLDDLTAGTYLVKVKSSDNFKTFKLVKL